MTPFRGQTLNAGHFLHPTANATGHSVILTPQVVSLAENASSPDMIAPRLQRLVLVFSRPVIRMLWKRRSGTLLGLAPYYGLTQREKRTPDCGRDYAVFGHVLLGEICTQQGNAD